MNTKLLPVALAALLMLCGCGRVGDYSVELPGGYELVRTHGHSRMIWGSRGSGDRSCVVPADIVEVGVHEGYVFGRLVNRPELDFDPVRKPGYFLLDTSSGEALLGLDEQEWSALMHEKLGTHFPRWLLTRPDRLGLRLSDIFEAVRTPTPKSRATARATD
ncbi:MAG: hypothetical protein R6V05_01235 [Candidatus Brocadiia bacterium]